MIEIETNDNGEVALITDTHFGCSKFSELFFESQMRFYREQFIPELRERNIKTIIHLGDFYDNRSNINNKLKLETYNFLKDDLRDFKVFIIVGNHDIYYKNTIEVTTLKLFELLPNVTIVDKFTHLNSLNKDILLCPWQINKTDLPNYISSSSIDFNICMGHFEIEGFYLNNNTKCDEGFASNFFFENFDVTLSGHFHKQNTRKIAEKYISYIGNAFHLNRSDIGEKRGYSIFNIKTNEIELIENKKSLRFVKLEYPNKFKEEDIRNNIVDIFSIVDKDFSEIKFLDYVKKVEECNPIISPIIKLEHKSFVDGNEVEDIKFETVSEMIENYVDIISNELGTFKESVRNKLLNYLDESKNEAIDE